MVETKRLILEPLKLRQLKLWTEDISLLEKELNCLYRAEPAEGIFLGIIKDQIKALEMEGSNYLYQSFWLVIRKNDRVVVGSAGFKDIPNEKKEVEIGYGLGKAFEGNGYMTETVKALCDWAMSQDNVLCIIAETEPDNFKSQNILKRCGFDFYKQEENMWWRLGS